MLIVTGENTWPLVTALTTRVFLCYDGHWIKVSSLCDQLFSNKTKPCKLISGTAFEKDVIFYPIRRVNELRVQQVKFYCTNLTTTSPLTMIRKSLWLSPKEKMRLEYLWVVSFFISLRIMVFCFKKEEGSPWDKGAAKNQPSWFQKWQKI